MAKTCANTHTDEGFDTATQRDEQKEREKEKQSHNRTIFFDNIGDVVNDTR